MTTPTSAQTMTTTELAGIEPLGAVIRFTNFAPSLPHTQKSESPAAGRARPAAIRKRD